MSHVRSGQPKSNLAKRRPWNSRKAFRRYRCRDTRKLVMHATQQTVRAFLAISVAHHVSQPLCISENHCPNEGKPSSCRMCTTTRACPRLRHYPRQELTTRPIQYCHDQWREWYDVCHHLVQGSCSHQDNRSSHARDCERDGAQRPATLCAEL